MDDKTRVLLKSYTWQIEWICLKKQAAVRTINSSIWAGSVTDQTCFNYDIFDHFLTANMSDDIFYQIWKKIKISFAQSAWSTFGKLDRTNHNCSDDNGKILFDNSNLLDIVLRATQFKRTKENKRNQTSVCSVIFSDIAEEKDKTRHWKCLLQ